MTKPLTLLAVVAVALACGSEAGVAPSSANTAVRVVASAPADGATGVSRLPAPSVTFGGPVLASSIAGAITMTVVGTGEPVLGTVAYDSATHTADFWPYTMLPARTRVTLSVSTSATDADGHALAAPFSLTFVTGDSPASIDELPPSSTPLLVSRATGAGAARDVFALGADGSGAVKLTDDPGDDVDASWSPDGRHIAFASNRAGSGYDVYVMREDGRGLLRLTSGSRDETQPRWSADAQRIVFASTSEGIAPPNGFYPIPRDIWAMNANGTAQVNLTRTPTLDEEWPEWSPDDTRLLFTRMDTTFETPVRELHRHILVANADATGAAPLHATDASLADDVGAWSPDGSRIAFSAYDARAGAASGRYVLFTAAPDGTGLRQLAPTDTLVSRRFPAWSPDASALVFTFAPVTGPWARALDVGVGRLDLATGAIVELAPTQPSTAVLGPQAWRR